MHPFNIIMEFPGLYNIVTISTICYTSNSWKSISQGGIISFPFSTKAGRFHFKSSFKWHAEDTCVAIYHLAAKFLTFYLFSMFLSIVLIHLDLFIIINNHIIIVNNNWIALRTGGRGLPRGGRLV